MEKSRYPISKSRRRHTSWQQENHGIQKEVEGRTSSSTNKSGLENAGLDTRPDRRGFSALAFDTEICYRLSLKQELA